MKVRINERGPFAVATFSKDVDAIDVTNPAGTTKPDPAWTFVDDSGHFHAYAADGSTPTLLRAEDLLNECTICHQQITPDTIWIPGDTYRKLIPGRSRWTLTLNVTDFARVLGVYPGDRVSVRRGREWFGVGIFEQVERVAFSYDIATITGGGLHQRMKP